jgi:hypothetical protein
MNRKAIIQMKKQILLNPTGENIAKLVNELKRTGSEPFSRDLTLISSLAKQTNQSSEDYRRMQAIAPEDTDTAKPKGVEAESRRGIRKAQAKINVPASAQLCFINGLGDMEWIQQECVRQCLEDMLLHAQALPRPEAFEVSLTGKFQSQPALTICTPFHSIDYNVETKEPKKTEEWTTYQYQCSVEHQANQDGKTNILYELAFKVSAGDYFQKLSYSF